MKKLFLIVLPLVAFAAGCQKTDSPSPEIVSGEEIVFGLEGDGIDFDVQTKTSITETVSSVFWQINTGSSATYPVGSTATSVSSGTVSTGKYWPSSAVSYTFYVSNVTFNSSSKVITATNATDIVCGKASASSSGASGTSVSVTLNHIFARTGSLTLSKPSGYDNITVSKWEIASSGSASGTAGSYTIGGSWGSTATTALSRQEFTGSSDLYLIPGSYTVYVTYTITKGAYSEEFTKSATVTLEQGKVNSISATAPAGSATEIKFSVTVATWGSATLNPTFS